MDFLILAFVTLGCHLVSSSPVPHYPPYNFYMAQPYLDYSYPYLPRPAIFAPPPPLRRTASVTPNTQAPLVHNSITYKVDPEAGPDDALEVTQFHAQDAAGQVVFGFNIPNQSRMEARSMDGSVRGSYSYQDPTGKIVKMHYWDEGTGFHTAGNNLPLAFYTPPQYTPEVQAARDRHFQLYSEALTAALASGTGAEDEEPQSQPNAPAVSVAADSDLEADDTQDTPVMPDYDTDSDAVAIDADFSYLKQAPVSLKRGEPEASRKQVAEVELPVSDLLLDNKSRLAIARTGADGYQYLVPVGAAEGLSESQHAERYGAIPVAAVHDAQVSPAQSQDIDHHQLKPILVRTGTEQVKSS